MARRLGELQPDLIFLPGNFHALLANGLRAATDARRSCSRFPIRRCPGAPFARAIFRRLTRGVTGFAAMNGGLAAPAAAHAAGAADAVVTLHDPVYVQPVPPGARTGNHILWIGRLERQKDPLLALEVMAAAKGMRLTMLGEGRMRRAVEQRIQALGLQDRVTLQGHAEAIEPFLAAADALLITSRYEGGPAVAVEALAHGRAGGQHRLFFPAARSDQQARKPALSCASRNPADFAAALRETSGAAACAGNAAALAAPFEPRLCAQAYLDWFDS